jgi:hypothetical protein
VRHRPRFGPLPAEHRRRRTSRPGQLSNDSILPSKIPEYPVHHINPTFITNPASITSAALRWAMPPHCPRRNTPKCP